MPNTSVEQEENVSGKITSVPHTNLVGQKAGELISERKLGIWIRGYLVIPMIVSACFVIATTYYYSTSNAGHKSWGPLFLPAIISAILALSGRSGIVNFKRWGIYIILIDIIFCPIALAYAGYQYRPFLVSDVELPLVIWIIGFVLTWLVFRNKWKYFEGPSIRIFGLKL